MSGRRDSAQAPGAGAAAGVPAGAPGAAGAARASGPPRASGPTRRATLQPAATSGASLLSQGEPMLWLTGGALAVCLAMIAGLLLLVLAQGLRSFWPQPVVRLETAGGAVMGEVTRRERFEPDPALVAGLAGDEARRARAEFERTGGRATRRLLRTGNFELTGEHFTWVSDWQVAGETRPPWAVLVERLTWGRFYGEAAAFLVDGVPAAAEPAGAWALFRRHHPEVAARRERRERLERRDIGRVNRRLEEARLAVRAAELRAGASSPAHAEALRRQAAAQAEGEREFARLRAEIDRLNAENDRYQLVLVTASGAEKRLALADVVRAYPANRLSAAGKLGVYASRWREYLGGEPREANSEGGVFPALFGTVVMTLLMSLAVLPFGVLAALYLREYAKAGPIVSAVRIAVNNLAGVPSIVFGVFGLGFFCYIVGGSLDSLFFPERLPSPTYGTGGVLWASLTLALLTLPVVIVATEEALAAVPSSMREGSYACGASKWQTIRRIVLPRALPGIMTGMILAMARGAGEVAPLMLVGAVKLAPRLPVDGTWPYLHPERSFMHLGFHVYDLGFQSQNSEAAKPMVFTTTLLLIAIVAVLNVAAVALRKRLRRRFLVSQF